MLLLIPKTAKTRLPQTMKKKHLITKMIRNLKTTPKLLRNELQMSDASSTYSYSDSSGDFNPAEDEIPQDILGPEDGQGATNAVEDLGNANW